MFRTCLRCTLLRIPSRSKYTGKGGPPEWIRTPIQKHKRPILKKDHTKRTLIVKRFKAKEESINDAENGQEALFQPVDVLPPKKEEGDTDIGEELVGKLDKNDVNEVLKKFQSPMIKKLAAENGIEGEIFSNSIQSFRRYCLHADFLPVDLHIILSDVIRKAGHSDDLYPYFLQHAKQVYPHLNCLEDLKSISDITNPAQWYPLARQSPRKIIFHAGPTNSGKTYHALKKFMTSERGTYCGPLRLLAMEVFDKCNEAGTPCDLVTGETRKYLGDTPSDHVACTVEMVNTAQRYDVAVIDEIQMIADEQRGWAWTRAILGAAADEVHVCGEERAVDMIRELVTDIGDEFEVRRYKRLTKLTYLNESLGGYDNIKPGDCIVCFRRTDIFKLSRKLTSLGHNCAVIYGALPPGTKIMQSKRFNDPDNPCNVLIATDAIGMGLNLAIKRVIFYSLLKFNKSKDGTFYEDYLTTSQAKQIGGRAGRYRTQYEDGEVTTFNPRDLKLLLDIVNSTDEPIQKAGMSPTLEQIEMFSYHLPKAPLSNLLNIFEHVCQLDMERYFMCSFQDFKEMAEVIEHLPMPLRAKYTFCSAPLRISNAHAKVMFMKMARRFANAEAISFEWLYDKLGAPFKMPRNVAELERLEGAFFTIDIYLWLGYRFPDMFYDSDAVRALRIEIDNIIQKYMKNTTFIDVTQNAQQPKEIRRPSKAALRQIEKMYGAMQKNPMSKYDPAPKKEALDDSESESDTEMIDAERLRTIAEQINKSINMEKEQVNPMAKYDPPPKQTKISETLVPGSDIRGGETRGTEPINENKPK